jgi:long-chain fatty acid transport protein
MPNKQQINKLKTHYLPQTVCFLAISTAAFCPGSAFGLGFALPDQDAFATARGNAFVATANDTAAIFYNPAGITQLEGMNSSVGAYGIIYGSTFHGDGTSINSKTEYGLIPQVFSTLSIPKIHVTLGLGTYSPYGLRYEWPSSAPFIGNGETGAINYVRVNPVVAYQICPTLSIAAGPTLNYADAELVSFPGFVNHTGGHDYDVGYNAGIFWHPVEQHAFGVSYRSATDMNFEGHTSIPPVPAGDGGESDGVHPKGEPPPPPKAGPTTTASTANVHFPQTLDFGYSYRPTKDWNFEADGVWTDWSSLRTVGITPFAALGDDVTFDWKKSWMIDFGATRYLGETWHVSGGFMYSMNSVPDANFNPLVPDSDRYIFSVGVGQKYKRFSWDAAYQLAWGPSRSVSGDAYPPADGSYTFLGNALTINFGLHF